MGAVSAIAGDSERFYVASSSEVAAHDPQTGRVLWQFHGTHPAPADEGRDNPAVAFGSGRLFFADGGHSLRRLDPSSGAPLWELDLQTRGIFALHEHDGIVLVSIEPLTRAFLEFAAVDAQTGKLLWHQRGGGRLLPEAGPEGVLLLGSVQGRTGILLLDPRSGSVRASFRIGDGPGSFARAVDGQGTTWVIAPAATGELLGLRLGPSQPPTPRITLRGRVTFASSSVPEQALPGFIITRDPDRSSSPYQTVRTKADGTYEFTLAADDVIALSPTQRGLEAQAAKSANKNNTCMSEPMAYFLRKTQVLPADRFDFEIWCQEIIDH